MQTGQFTVQSRHCQKKIMPTNAHFPSQTAPELAGAAKADPDLSVLDEMVRFDTAKFRKFALLFMGSMETVLAQVDSAIAAQDMATLAAMGHRARSTTLSVGAHGLSLQFQRMEERAVAGEVAQAIQLAQGLRPLFTDVCRALHTRMGPAP